jgi:hypothetical protein
MWVTNCYAVKFTLSYDGSNPVILQLQMHLMCWDVDIIHCANNFLVDADYWSQLNADLCFNPTFHEYLQFISLLCALHPPLTDLPMQPENMPYYWGPCIQHPADLGETIVDAAANSLLTTIVTQEQNIQPCLANYPIQFGKFPSLDKTYIHPMYNSEFPALAFCMACFNWAVYLFNSGHFASTISMRNLPFDISLTCNPYAYVRALFIEFTKRRCILPSAAALLDHICKSGDQSLLNGYLIHSHRYQASEPTTAFWSLEASIVAQLQAIWKLRMFVAFVHPDNDSRSVSKFVTQLFNSGWVISSTKCSFPDYGDSVVGTMTIVVGVHMNTQSKVDAMMFRTPPSSQPLPLAVFVWQPFNKREYGLSFAKDDASLNNRTMPPPQVKLLLAMVSSLLPSGLRPLYSLHLQGSDTTILNGAAVLLHDSLCPPFDCSSTINIFKCHFGIKFHDDDHTYVQPFLPFEFTLCFGLIDKLRYQLSQHGNWFALEAGIPALTSVWVFDHILDCLLSICNLTVEIFEPNQFTAPAATIQAFLSGTVGISLLSRECWIQAYDTDKDLKRIREIVANPSTLSNALLHDINYNYCSALRKLLIVMEDVLLIYREPIAGKGSYTRLQLVPKEFYNILFVAFHSNPVGGHLNAYRTLHCLRLCFYWPGMYSYIK